jgi:hypothetical protein
MVHTVPLFPKQNNKQSVHRYNNKKAPRPESVSELYRPSDRRLSAKLVPTFSGWMVPRGQHDGSLWPYSRLSRPDATIIQLRIFRCQ